ncbi:hypothetical protein DSO57_1029050 [Entomophthora muscae]|uniref:Uncharacterized protein n=1 Tax=Entomophthora muscae TaxID=34485 RepID=A0ACC2T1C7_9FUNG|nr:hypothetical protein DSO57_1029050 [Entomophthora muscae]
MEKVMQVYFTKYAKLKANERYAIKALMFGLEFAVCRLPVLSIGLVPLVILVAERWCLYHAILLLWWAGELWLLKLQMHISRRIKKRKMGYWKPDKRVAAVEKVLEHLGDPADSAEQLLQKWHLQRVNSSPCMAHYVKTLVWLFFDKAVNELSPRETSEAQRMLMRFKETLDIPNTNQEDHGITPRGIRLSIDPVKVVYKSFLFYLVSI